MAHLPESDVQICSCNFLRLLCLPSNRNRHKIKPLILDFKFTIKTKEE